MKEEIYLPFFSIKDYKLSYLGKYEICNLPKEKNICKSILKQYGAIIEKNIKTKLSKTKEILVIEPHPDDFALSALGYIQENMNVTVLNIFSKTKIESFTWNEHVKISEKEYEDLRMLESQIAIHDILNYDFKSLKKESTRFKTKTKKEIQKDISNAIKKILLEKKIDIIMIPMGIGEHPDHICVYEAMLDEYHTLNESLKIILYPEYPYARCKKSYEHRLTEIKKVFDLEENIVNIEDKLEEMASVISVYKSQFDDINKAQMLAIIREDGRAIAKKKKKKSISLVYYKIKDKNDNM